MRQVDIKNFDDYQITDDGRVWSKEKNKFLKPYVGKNGYSQICLYKQKKKKLCYIHRLVAEAFIDNLENKPCIDHINTLKNDNRVENLRWCTPKENYHNKITEERHKGIVYSEESKRKMSDSQPKRKVKQYLLDGTFIAEFESINDASRQTNLSLRGIYNCCTGGYFSKARNKWKKCNKYKGYIWKF